MYKVVHNRRYYYGTRGITDDYDCGTYNDLFYIAISLFFVYIGACDLN